MTRGLPVVSKFIDNRQARSISNTYNYTGGRSDAMGKGWLGFRQTRVTDGITGPTSPTARSTTSPGRPVFASFSSVTSRARPSRSTQLSASRAPSTDLGEAACRMRPE